MLFIFLLQKMYECVETDGIEPTACGFTVGTKLKGHKKLILNEALKSFKFMFCFFSVAKTTLGNKAGQVFSPSTFL